MAVEDPLQGVAQVAQQMETVGDLHGFRRAETSSFGIAAGAVTGDDLYAGMISQPGGNGLGVAIGQQVDGPVPLQIEARASERDGVLS